MTRGAKVRRGVVALSVVVAGAAGCAAGRPVERVSRAAPPASRSAVAGATTPTAAGPTRTTEVINFPVGSWRRLSPSPPARLEIPAIGVSSPLVRLGLLADGTMEVPRDYGVAGWFTGAPEPGQLGPAVIAGHVDSRTGPAVFYRLRDLRPGDQIRVVRADGRVVRFEVESLARYPKREFPDEEVFGATTTPSLRLITCAGDFDRSRRSYRDNLVVSAIRVRDGAGAGSGSGGAAGR
jgi:LPXTG-site transpeptidase (sortase) family protein